MIMTQTSTSIRCLRCCNIEGPQRTEGRITELHRWVLVEELTMKIQHGVSQNHSLVFHLVPGDGVGFIGGYAR